MNQAAYSIADLRKRAQRQLPRPVFDFADGGAETESTLLGNERSFDRFGFVPNPLNGVAQPDLSVKLFDQTLSLPVMIGPAGLAGLFWPDGELAAARAAAAAGTGICLSHGSVCTMEQFADTAKQPRWMQVFIYKDRGFTESLIERAQKSRYDALVLTIDNQWIGKRERDLNNGFTIPPSFSLVQKMAMLRNAPWLMRMRKTLPSITFGNYVDYLNEEDPSVLAAWLAANLDRQSSWSDVRWLRSVWSGPLLLKGVLSANEARRAIDSGIDGIICSNHGGRQLDGALASFDALPDVVQAVQGAVPVLLDGGVRRGSHVVKAIAQGAAAVLIARPWLWGLATQGEAGVTKVLSLMREEIERAMGMVGCAQIADIGPASIRAHGAKWSG